VLVGKSLTLLRKHPLSSRFIVGGDPTVGCLGYALFQGFDVPRTYELSG
jgi:hypothetical protein